MIISTRVWAGLGLSLLSCPVVAQQAPAAHPWSVGLQATVQRYAVRYSNTGRNELSMLPLQVTAGYQLTPRLGTQVGVAYRKTNGYDQFLPNPTGDVERNDPGFRSFAVPLLLRYTVGRRPEKLLQAQVLGGVTLLHSSRTISQRTVSTGQVYSIEDSLTKLQLSVGAGLTYNCSSRVSGVAELLLNRPTQGSARQGSWLAYYSAGLGARYHF